MALGIWLWKKRPRRVAKEVVEEMPAGPVVPAHVEALAALDRLAQARLPQQGLWYEHQTELSAIVRRFLERRFGSPRESLTTRELCLHLAWRGIAGADIDRLRVLLRVADLAKFARTDPGADESLNLEKEARALVLAWAEPERRQKIQTEDAAEETPQAETGT
jgi:hypothetical protein